MQPRFSILVPVYNRERYVHQTIDSVLAQTLKNYEILAIDDGSTDASPEILRSYGTQIRFLEQRNQGPEVALNSAAAVAHGEYLVALDSDDFLFPFALETFDRVIKKFNSPPLILGSLAFFQDREAQKLNPPAAEPIEVFKSADFFSHTRPLGTNCIAVRKTVFDQVGGLRSSTPESFHGNDTNFLLKAGAYGPCVVIDKPALYAYRLHEKNSTNNVRAIANALLRLADTERRGGYGGGKHRRRDRYAYIGGRSAAWAVNYCWRVGQRKLALQLLAGTAPMVAAAVWRKVERKFRPAQERIVLERESFVESSDAMILEQRSNARPLRTPDPCEALARCAPSSASSAQ
jgi:glycosyltransferase involved in cell wall biosynthesis